MHNIIYMDNAATTKISDNVLQSMLPYLKDNYGNASSQYSLGRDSKMAIETARKQIAEQIGANPNEIYFTSGGSESDNLAIRGVIKNAKKCGYNHIITSNFEHHAVLNTCKDLEENGFEVTYIPVDKNGFVNPKDIENAITDKTALVTIMYANNEIGTIQPIREIADICDTKGIIFHTDAVQAIGHIPINVHRDNIDLLSLSGHKIYAPKGVGVLYIRNGIDVSPIITGGKQEKHIRAGTENVASIVGLGMAMQEVCTNIDERNKYVNYLKNTLMNGLYNKIPYSFINGNINNRLDGNLNISFKGVEGESLLLMLDMKGICVSAGSACTSGSLQPSHVLKAIGVSDELAYTSIRFSLNENNTIDEVEIVIKEVTEIVKKLRNASRIGV